MADKAKSVAEAAVQLQNIIRGDGDDKWAEVVRLLSNAKEKGIVTEVLRTKFAVETTNERGEQRTLHDVLLLHLACAFKPPAAVVLFLIAEAPDTVRERDEDRDTALHYACLKGASDDVIKLLANQLFGATHAKEIQGSKDRTPLHHYFAANADKNDNPSLDVVKTLCTRNVIDKTDDTGKTPFMLFIDYATHVDQYLVSKGRHYEQFGLDVDFQAKGDNCKDILNVLLDSKPHGTLKFICHLRNLPSWLFFHALANIHVERILNKTIAHAFCSAVLTLDFYVHVLLIVAFTVAAANRTIKSNADGTEDRSSLYDEGWEEPCLFVGIAYLIVRELVQMMAFISLQMLYRWLSDLWNWLDVSCIALLFFSTTHLFDTTAWVLPVGEGFSDTHIRTLVMITAGIVWLLMLSFLKSTYLSFSVFVSGLLHVMRILVPFAITSGIILSSFALMYFIDSGDSHACPAETDETAFIDLTFCTLRGSYLKVYTMFVNGEIDETDFTSEQSTMWLSVVFGFLVMVLLLNVLIAIITDSYSDVKKRGADVFWSHRYNAVLEFTAIWNAVSCFFCCCSRKRQRPPTGSTAQPLLQHESESTYILNELLINPLLDYALDEAKSGRGSNLWQSSVNRLRDTIWWELCLAKWDCSCYYAMLPLVLLIKAIIMLVVFPISKLLVLLFLLVWILAGVATLGILWPPQIREFLFCPSVITLRFSEEDIIRREVKEVREGLQVASNEIREVRRQLQEGFEQIAALVQASAAGDQPKSEKS